MSAQRQQVGKQRIIKPRHVDTEMLVKKAFSEEKKRHPHVKTLADLAANDTFHFVSEYWPGSKTLFPSDRGMNLCDKYYPYADGGPLWIDEEEGYETRNFELKKKVMAEQGNRYIVIMRDMTEQDIMELVA